MMHATSCWNTVLNPRSASSNMAASACSATADRMRRSTVWMSKRRLARAPPCVVTSARSPGREQRASSDDSDEGRAECDHDAHGDVDRGAAVITILDELDGLV